MLSRIQYLVEGLFESSAGLFWKMGLSPNAMTVIGFAFTIGASLFYGWSLPGQFGWLLAATMLVLSGYFDALDGAMARRYLRASRVGGVLDSVLDRLGEIAVYSGIALGELVDFRLVVWALSAALMVSYVRARVEAEGASLKGVGLAERPERLLILLVSTLVVPVYGQGLNLGVGLIAALASLTVIERVYRAIRVLSQAKTSS